MSHPCDSATRLKIEVPSRFRSPGSGSVALKSVSEPCGRSVSREDLLERGPYAFDAGSAIEVGPAAVYRLARLYESEGRTEEALGRYRDFLELWSGADPELPPVVEARVAVERLEGRGQLTHLAT